MRFRVLAVAATATLISIAAGACAGKTAVKTADDASRYVDDVLRGTKPQEFKLAEGATPVARAAVEDAGALSSLHQVVDEAPSAACDVAGLVSNAADALPDSVAPVTLEPSEMFEIKFEASNLGVSQDYTTRVVDAALNMAQSTWVEAADKACNVAQNL